MRYRISTNSKIAFCGDSAYLIHLQEITSSIINMNITVEPIPTLKDNYVWTLIDKTHPSAVIVDPGEAMPVLDFLHRHRLRLLAILITHHHWDHTNGIAEILQEFPVPVYGPASENIATLTHPLTDNMV